MPLFVDAVPDVEGVVEVLGVDGVVFVDVLLLDELSDTEPHGVISTTWRPAFHFTVAPSASATDLAET